MADSQWVTICNVTGVVGFSTAVVTNSTLLFLVYKKSSKNMGVYKSLLIFFCYFTFTYSCIEILLRPLIHNDDDTLFLIQQKWFDLSPFITRLIPTAYCGCYAMSFNFFALQFIYRYVASCKPNFLRFFNGPLLKYWLLATFAISLSWALSALTLFPQTERTRKTFEHILRDSYGLDPYWLDYVPYKYFNEENGVRTLNFVNTLGILQHGLVIMFSFSIVFYCGIATYVTMKSYKGVSSKTRKLQLQLFQALVIQTAFPMLFVYMPIGYMFACPYFRVQLGAIANYQTVMAQLYPGIDPCVLIILIKDYRKELIRILLCRALPRKYSVSFSSLSKSMRSSSIVSRTFRSNSINISSASQTREFA